jgi:glycosyltransferase involved in cell wall biosynthesis
MNPSSGRAQSFERPRSASIVINNYNYARFLPISIESALSQTHPCQVIVVDDGSTDGSQGVIESFGSRVEPVLQKNGGQGSALNAGFARATGDLVFFLDADDELYEEAIATVLARWREGTVMAHYWMDLVDAEGRPNGGLYPPPWRKLADGDVSDELLRTGTFSTTVTSGLAFSRAVLSRVMPMPQSKFKMAADGYLVRAMALRGPIQAIERSLAKYRRHGGNDSGLAAFASNPALFYRKKIAYLQNEHDIVRSFADALGLNAAENMGEADVDFLVSRLYSLALDREAHPIERDRLAELLFRYLSTRLRKKDDPIFGRVADAVTALGVSFLPPSAGENLVRWREVHTTRPVWLKHLATSYRDLRTVLRPRTAAPRTTPA